MSICGMMFCKRSHVSTKFTQMTYVKSSDLIKPPEEFFQKHLQQIPPSLRLAVEKVEVIEPTPTSAKPWSAVAPSAVTEAVDTEAAAVGAAEDVHSIGHVAPDRCVDTPRCGRCSARGQLTPAIGLAKVLRKIKSRFWLYKNGVGHLAVICLNSGFSNLLTSPSSLTRWVENVWDAFSHETHPNPI